MDELLETFNTSLKTQHVDNTEPEPGLQSDKNFEGLYKNWGKLGNQEERRKEILEVQRSNRNKSLDSFRGILEIVQAVEKRDFFGSHGDAYYRPNIYVAGFNKVSYRKVLMMSEWLVEKPTDLHENWFVVPCPKGVRMIVIANQGITKCFTKYGHFRFQERTALPGGNPCNKKKNDPCTVLDCFYYEKTNTMYVLDLLAWTQPMTDGEAEFRHFWLQSKFEEIPEISKISKKNQIIFKILPKTACSTESLNKVLQTYPMFENNEPPLDGFLFYHKHAGYVSGETPLVGWLFPYMVPEVLGEGDITIHDVYRSQKPMDYVSQADFIQKFEEKMDKKNRRRSWSSAMDTTDESTSNDGAAASNNETAALATSDMTEDDSTPVVTDKTSSNMESESKEVDSSEKSENKEEVDSSENNKETASKSEPDAMDAQIA